MEQDLLRSPKRVKIENEGALKFIPELKNIASESSTAAHSDLNSNTNLASGDVTNGAGNGMKHVNTATFTPIKTELQASLSLPQTFAASIDTSGPNQVSQPTNITATTTTASTPAAKAQNDSKPATEPQQKLITKSRLVLLAGKCMNRHIIDHLNSLRLIPDTPTTEVSVGQTGLFPFGVYTHINLCIEYDETFVASLESIRQFFLSHKLLFEKALEVGYHIVFNQSKKWSEYLEPEKLQYSGFLADLSAVCGEKVTQCSLIGKYDSSTVYVTEKDDLIKLGHEIADDIALWKNLKVCDYGENCIRFLPGVKFPDSLQVLNIGGGSSLETLTGFKMPASLKVLTASSSRLTTIDYVVFPPTLERLDLLENKLFFLNYVDLPSTLQALDLSRNQIDSLKNIMFPRNLKYLSVSNNPIECIKGVKFPESVEYLDVSCIPNESMTGIKFPDLTISLNLQQSMTNTRGLKLPPYVLELNMACNGVNSINPLRLPNLISKLYLANNNIKTLNKVTFPSALRELYLGNNLLTTLKNVQFPPTLEVLDLEMDPYTDDNEKYITSIKDVTFPPNLRVLRLGYHLIKLIESVEFPYNLQELSLCYNDLRVLRNARFGPKLKVLDLSGNQDLLSMDNVYLPELLIDLKIPNSLLGNLPATVVERANKHELLLTKSLPYIER